MHGWDWNVFLNDLARIAGAGLLGGVLGFERQWKGHWAGLRTHMMVSIGSAVFVMAGMSIAKDQIFDTTRVVQGIAAGIGFLGAGTILKLGEEREIKGLTTASSIWLAAALGVVAGMGEYGVAAAAALVSLFVLAILQPVEVFLDRHIESFNTSKAGKEDNDRD